MRDFNTEIVPYWKQLAHDKQNTLVDTVNYCIIKAMAAKEPNKVKVAAGILQDAFKPVTNLNKYENNGRIAYHALYCYRMTEPSSDQNRLLHFALTEMEEYTEFNQILERALRRLHQELGKWYTYFILDKNLPTPEEKTVQGMHAAMKLGATLANEVYLNPGIAKGHVLNELNFVVCEAEGAEGVRGAAEYLYSLGHETIEFRDTMYNKTNDDILSGGVVTAIASYPVKSTKRRPMRRYRLMKFPK